MARFQKNKRDLFKEKCLAYLGGKKCSVCGNDWLPPRCYSFHHKQPALKCFEISKGVTGKKWNEIKTELDKCIVVCMNCHALMHSEFKEFINA